MKIPRGFIAVPVDTDRTMLLDARQIAIVLGAFDDAAASVVGMSNGTRTLVSLPVEELVCLMTSVLGARAELQTCPQCDVEFEAGHGGRRIDATFCSDPCRVRFNSLRRTRERNANG